VLKKFVVYTCIWCLCSTSILSTLTFAYLDDQPVDETIEVLFRLYNGKKADSYSIEMSKEDFTNYWESVDEFQKSLKDEISYKGLVDILGKILPEILTLKDSYLEKGEDLKNHKDYFSALKNDKVTNNTMAKHNMCFVSITGTVSKCSIGGPLFVFLSLTSILYLFAYLFQFPVIEKCLFPFLIPAIFIVTPRLFYGFLLDRLIYTNTPLKRPYIPIAAIWSENKDLDVNIWSRFQQYHYEDVGSLLFRNFIGLWISVPILKQNKIIGFTGYSGVDTLNLDLSKITQNITN